MKTYQRIAVLLQAIRNCEQRDDNRQLWDEMEETHKSALDDVLRRAKSEKYGMMG